MFDQPIAEPIAALIWAIVLALLSAVVVKKVYQQYLSWWWTVGGVFAVTLVTSHLSTDWSFWDQLLLVVPVAVVVVIVTFALDVGAALLRHRHTAK